MIALPKFVSLDTATLGRLAFDFWSSNSDHRTNAKRFLEALAGLNCFVVISFTHLCELFRHQENNLVLQRLRFLRHLPLIAWPRPYDRAWFVGSTVDIGRRELHAYVHGNVRGLKPIRDAVGLDLWETGTGVDMFPDRESFWISLITEIRRTLEQDRYIASFAVAIPNGVDNLTIGEARRLEPISKAEIPNRVADLAKELEGIVSRVGDRKQGNVAEHAVQFAREAGCRVKSLLEGDCSVVSRVCEQFGIPENLLTDDMTVGGLGELGVLAGNLKVLGRALQPPASVDLSSVPPGSLPTITMNRALIAIQQRAVRVSGSDLGDGHLAALSLYTHVTEVDRRTCEYISQFRRKHSDLASVIGPIVKTSDYDQLLNEVRTQLSPL